MKKLLECQNLCKSFGKKQILKDVSFEIDEGDILAFIGPNGSGKTTTIKLILGLQKIDKGSVSINSYDIEKDFVKAIEKVGAIVEDLKKGMVTYKNDKFGNIHTVIGKVSFDEKKLAENLTYVITTISKAKPQTVKGTFIENIAISTTMGPGIKLDKNSFDI